MTWDDLIQSESQKDYFKQIKSHLADLRMQNKMIYPADEHIFEALKLTPLDKVKVVILGQDPYHAPNQAHGLAFSVLPQANIPPSLRNIYKELASDINGFTMPNHGYLASWAMQGVLLLNTVLTVEDGKAHSHANIGWQTFTDEIIKTINDKKKPVVFLLWGSAAQKKSALISHKHHTILTAAHPSPLSAYRGFFGSKHFSKTNQILQKNNIKTIDWQPYLPDQID